jgi:hypothetical protein
MKTVFIISPLRGTPSQLAACKTDAERADLLEANIERAERLCHEVTVKHGHAAFAGHVFYPLFLDDRKPEERACGMKAGRAWLAKSDEAWVWGKEGASAGMVEDVAFATLNGVPVLYPPDWQE